MARGKPLRDVYSRYLKALDRTAVEAAAWVEVCDSLAEMLNAKGAALVADDYARHRLSTPHSPSLAEAFAEALASGWNRQDIRHKAWKMHLQHGFVRDQDVISPEAMRKHPFYAEFLLPNQLLWSATTLFTIDGSIWGSTVHASPDRGPFDDDDLESLLQLRQPLEVAAKRGALLGQQRVQSIEDLLSSCSRGLAVLDWNGRIIAASPCGEELLKAADIVRQGQLHHSQPNLAAGLGRLAGFTLEDGLDRPRPQLAPVTVPTADGRAICVDAIPLPRDFQSLVVNAAAVLVLTHVEPETDLDEILVDRFRLTGRERQLVRHLIDGKALSQAAATMGISVATARHHLKSVFSKTGTNRQAELVAHLSRSRNQLAAAHY